jgi:hypothetical protein
VYRNVVVLSPCPAPEVWCTDQKACSYKGICSNIASELSALVTPDTQQGSAANADYEDAKDMKTREVVDQDPPYIRVEKLVVRLCIIKEMRSMRIYSETSGL